MKRLLERIRRPSAAARRSRSINTAAAGDIVSRLPIELHILILEYLDIDDVRAGLAACRSWRCVWLSDDVWPWLADRWAPGLARHIQATTGPEAAGEAFRRAVTRGRRRVSGRFAWALHHGLVLEDDGVFRLSRAADDVYRKVPELAEGAGRFPRFMFYSGGRIAWWPEAYGLPYLAVVDDLRAPRRRRVYLYPGADAGAGADRSGYLTALGDRLLLMGRGATLHAWHLDDERRATAPALPHPIARTVPEGDTVLIVTEQGAVFLWTFGHDALRPVAAAAACYAPGRVLPDREALRPPLWRASRVSLRVRATGMAVDFALHPSAPGVFFLATLHERRLVVHEFAADGRHAAAYPLEGPGRDGDGGGGSVGRLPGRWMEGAGPLRWEKIDAHGGFCLLPVWQDTTWPLSEPDREPRAACECCDGVVAVCFNVYTRAFSFLCYSFRWFMPSITTCLIWNGRLHAAAKPGRRLPIISLRSCAERSAHDGQALVPLYSTAPRRKKDPVGLVRRHRLDTFPDTFQLRDRPRFRLLMQRSLDFALDVEQVYAPSPEQRPVVNPELPHPTQSLCGDDDFLVHVSSHEYTVWSFED